MLTGPEFVERVLLPLAQSDALAGRISTGHRVVAVGRSGLTRSDFAGHPIRANVRFGCWSKRRKARRLLRRTR